MEINEPIRKRNRYPVSPEEFARVWETSATTKEAAERLGMPPQIAAARAGSYRKRGAKLKHMPRRQHNAVDIGRLNDIIQQNHVEPHH